MLMAQWAALRERALGLSCRCWCTSAPPPCTQHRAASRPAHACVCIAPACQRGVLRRYGGQFAFTEIISHMEAPSEVMGHPRWHPGGSQPYQHTRDAGMAGQLQCPWHTGTPGTTAAPGPAGTKVPCMGVARPCHALASKLASHCCPWWHLTVCRALCVAVSGAHKRPT